MKLFLTPNPDPPHNLMTRYPGYDDLLRPVGLTDDELLQLAIERARAVGSIPKTSPIYIVDDKDLPDNDHLFNAWEWSGTAVRVNMEKARALHMDRIREVRNTRLAALDVPFMRAVESGDTREQQRISREKQILRDIPQTLDLSAESPARLKAIWPAELLHP